MKKMVVAMLAGTMLLSSGLQASAAGLRDVFDAEYYANSYKDLKEAFGTDEEALYKHFLEYGLKEGRVMNPVLDVAAYRGKYEDLDKAFGDNWDAYVDHYFTYGVNENRDNGTDFDLKKYKAAYEDLREELGEEDNFLFAKHYIEFGQDENRVKGNKSYEEPKPAASQEEVVAPVVPDSDNISYECDANGNVIKEIDYNEDGTVSWITTYTYDENGKLSEYKGYDGDGNLYYTTTVNRGEDGSVESEKTVTSGGWSYVSVFDDNGRVSYTENYDEAGNYYSKEVEKYDENGKNIGYTVYYADGDSSEFVSMMVDGSIHYVAVKHAYADGRCTVNEVNDKAQIARSTFYDAEGKVLYYDEYKYEDGKYSEEWEYNADGTLRVHRVYEYDEQGKQAQTTNYFADGSYSINMNNGNLYINKWYDADGKFSSWSETLYDDEFKPVSLKSCDESGNVIAEYEPVYNEEEGYYTWVQKEA